MRNTIGVVLAGGTGSRLLPLTRTVSKHLLPVNGHPMLHWPIRTLASLGVDLVVVVVGGRSCGEIVEQFGSRYDTGDGVVSLCYVHQDRAGGIPDALACAASVVGSSSAEDVVVVLGDNVFPEVPSEFRDVVSEGYSGLDEIAAVVSKLVDRPERYGCVAVDVDGRAFGSLVEKPTHAPPGGCAWHALLGLYLLPVSAFRRIEDLEPSDRGELEIVDLLSKYRDRLVVARYDGPWVDAGEHETLRRANSTETWGC